MRYEIKVIQEIDSSHQLKLPYESGCNNLHGHRWKVEVVIMSERLNEQDMVVDFQHVKGIIKRYDHIHLNDVINPATAEVIAYDLSQEIAEYLAVGEFGNTHALLTSLTLFETPSGSVTIWP